MILRKATGVIVFVFMTGCMTVPADYYARKELANTLFEKYHARAIASEEQHELQSAFLQWQIALQLRPGDQEAAMKVAELGKKIRQKADQHFKEGVAYWEKKEIEKARREFMTVLAYDPQNTRAADYLKERSNLSSFQWYEIQEGDTLQSIAKKKYGDPNLDFLIADVNDLRNGQRPQHRKRLKLPVLQKVLTDPREMPLATRGKVSRKQQAAYKKESADMSENSSPYDIDKNGAKEFSNNKRYTLAEEYLGRNEYQKALAILNEFDEPYRDVAAKIQAIEEELARQAEVHYRRGVQYFLQEKLEKAIKEWEAVMKLKPEHKKARREIEKAKSVLEGLGRQE